MATLGEVLIDWLQVYDVDTVFGIPGVHTVEMYRGLEASDIRHVTPRHEQGAGFMADGYARVTGKPGVAFVITGPGLTNILTPMAQAYADSIPMLVISSVGRQASLGMGGDLHEIRNQGLIAAQASAFSHRLTDAAQLPEVLARAWAVFNGGRPRPVHIEVPLDLLGAEAPAAGSPVEWNHNVPARASAPNVDAAVRLLDEAKRPLMLIGGGMSMGRGAIWDLQESAESLDAPVVMTANARGRLRAKEGHEPHPLAVPASPSLAAIRALIADSDVVLAAGTEFGRTDYDMYDDGGFEVPGKLIRLDVDPEQVMRGAIPDVPLIGCASLLWPELMTRIGPPKRRNGIERATKARTAAWEEIGPKYRRIVEFINVIRDLLPNSIIVSDSTQAAYAGNLFFDAERPRQWFNASTGYGALGYGLPAAIGAGIGSRATGKIPVVCIAGDGGVQFSLADLGTAVEEQLPLILIVWNNQGYGEIKDYMIGRDISPVGVDLHTPDFVAIGEAYGAFSIELNALRLLPDLLHDAARRTGPTVIEINEALVLDDPT